MTYSIEQAIQLMNGLPVDLNQDLVIQVMKASLESAGISVSDLFQSATQRKDEITAEILKLHGEISALHEAIELKTGQAAGYKEQLGEIMSFVERLGQ
jgi:hypothetical protein